VKDCRPIHNVANLSYDGAGRACGRKSLTVMALQRPRYTRRWREHPAVTCDGGKTMMTIITLWADPT